MATKIKRCLYVGLGGTGMNALLHTKKMFVETYGEVPPMIGFLGVDTDGGVYRKELMSKHGPVTIDPNEQLPIQVTRARDVYETSREHFGWVHEQNVFALTQMTRGAGQIRTNGRFALICNYSSMITRVKSAVDRICNARNIDNSTYDINTQAEVEVHMVFSVSGGTGAGTFLDMAYIIKETLPECKLTGYAVLPEVFENMADYGMERVKPNAYGSIYDLDWFMHLSGAEKQPVIFDYINNKLKVQGRPFNAIFFIDNQNENKDTYSNIDQLTEMISLALVTAAGELSTAADSVTDNHEKSIMNGDGIVGDKRAWVSGLGACEIIFRGHDLAEVTTLKYGQRLIQLMLNSCEDGNNIADNWIDSPDVNIRENNGAQNDNVIDFLLPKNPRFPMEKVDDSQNAYNEAIGYIENSAMPKDSEVQKKLTELKQRVSKELHKLVVRYVNEKCGIGTIKAVLTNLDSEIRLFLKEMEEEKDVLLKRQPIQDNAIKTASEELKAYAGRFWKRANKVADLEQAVCSAAVQLAVNRRDTLRHDKAILFFNDMLLSINEEQKHVKAIESKLRAVNNHFTDRLAELKNNVFSSGDSAFQINLATNFLSKIDVEDNLIQIADFVGGLKFKEHFYDIVGPTPTEIAKLITDYTGNLSSARKWESTTINDVLKEMDNQDPAELNNILTRALHKAQPLLCINTQGQADYRYGHFTYVGEPFDCQLLRENDRLQSLNGGEKILFARLGMTDRVIIYNQIGVVPAYMINALAGYKPKYDNSKIFSHIDANIFQRMQREKFSLRPTMSDGTKDIAAWVMGFVFGLIKHENGHYLVKDRTNGKALYQYWVELGEYRDDAFNAFKADLGNLQKQFDEHIFKYQKEKGFEAKQQLMDDVKQHYYEKYSQVDMTVQELEARGNERILSLMEKEIAFVEDNI